MPPCSNKVKTLLDILRKQKTKMPPSPCMEFTFKFFWLPGAWYSHLMRGHTMLNYLFRHWIGFRAVFKPTQVFMKERKNIVSHLLQKNWRRLLPVTQSSLTSNIRKMEFWGFQFSFKKDIFKLTEKSCEIYCLTIYAYFTMGRQVINHTLNFSEVSFPD